MGSTERSLKSSEKSQCEKQLKSNKQMGKNHVELGALLWKREVFLLSFASERCLNHLNHNLMSKVVVCVLLFSGELSELLYFDGVFFHSFVLLLVPHPCSLRSP